MVLEKQLWLKIGIGTTIGKFISNTIGIGTAIVKIISNTIAPRALLLHIGLPQSCLEVRSRSFRTRRADPIEHNFNSLSLINYRSNHHHNLTTTELCLCFAPDL